MPIERRVMGLYNILPPGLVLYPAPINSSSHILVDTLGLILAVVVTAANGDGRQGLVALLQTYFASGVKRLRKLWADEGYEAQ